MSIPLRVLIVEDSEDDTQLLLRELQRGSYNPTFERVETSEAMKAALTRTKWDIVISDFNMPHFSGPVALRVLQESGQDLPFIIVSGKIGEETAVAAMKLGAHDYIMKTNMKRLVAVIERELREAGVRRERKQAEEKIKYMAYYDPLTGLPNRALFHDRLQQVILAARRENKPVALLVMDLNRFNEINNTLGHVNGDLLLKQIGPRISGVLRESDTLARLEGDKFAVLLPSADLEGAIEVVQKIHKTLEQPFILEGLTLDVEASIGIALYPDHGEDANTLLQRADVAMSVAKESGDPYFVYAADRDQYKPDRLVLMGELRRAIDQNQLFLVYQPEVDLHTKRVLRVEALVRWRHPQRGVIPPDQFIMLAEQTGLIKPLTLWVLKEALRQCCSWYKAGIEISVAVNLSARNLYDPTIPEQVSELLETYGLAPHWLELEITESFIMADPARAMEVLTRLSRMGIQLAIDDFGTGYSSLGYLKKLPVHAVKIDRSFVMKMTVDNDDATIVRSTIDLAHNLNLKVVAEGVESAEIVDKLAAWGCDTAQGYYISRPIPAEELTRWLAESPWGLKRA